MLHNIKNKGKSREQKRKAELHGKHREGKDS